jgi:P27 family predicted phage terminase small subunit
MGRPAKSLELHELQGTRPHVPKHEHAFVAGRPRIPSHIKGAARAEFKRCCRILEERGTCTEGEMTLLALYATIYSRWVQAKSEIASELIIETTVLDNNGMPHKQRKLNPLLKVTADCESRLLAIAKSLGLTPVDRNRSKLTAANTEQEIIPGSALDELNQMRVVPIDRPAVGVAAVDPNEMDAGGLDDGIEPATEPQS